MKKYIKKTGIYLTLLATVMSIVLFMMMFFAYKNYYPEYYKGKSDKVSLKTRIRRTAGIVYQHHFNRAYRNYIYSLDIKPGDNILDFGAGTGNEAVFIAKKLSGVTGSLTCMDINADALKIARKRLKLYSNINFISGDITRISIKENSYDVIVSYFVIHHVDKNILGNTLNKLFYVLKNDGLIYVREPYSDGFSPEEINELMTNAGFTEIERGSDDRKEVNDAVFKKGSGE